MGFVRACARARVERSCNAGAPRAVRASPLELLGDLSARQSLSGRKEFGRVYGEGRRARGRFVTVYACRSHNASDDARLGLVVPSRGAPAAARNRMKRRLRAAFDASRPRAGFDYVIRAAPEVQHADFQLLVDELRRGLEAAAR